MVDIRHRFLSCSYRPKVSGTPNSCLGRTWWSGNTKAVSIYRNGWILGKQSGVLHCWLLLRAPWVEM